MDGVRREDLTTGKRRRKGGLTGWWHSFPFWGSRRTRARSLSGFESWLLFWFHSNTHGKSDDSALWLLTSGILFANSFNPCVSLSLSAADRQIDAEDKWLKGQILCKARSKIDFRFKAAGLQWTRSVFSCVYVGVTAQLKTTCPSRLYLSGRTQLARCLALVWADTATGGPA